ncbi:conjugal transfer fertility inhibition protein FinO [Salmonella enterica subsp. enterica serovar Enteritidis str. 81-2625]|nr:conjugal transfer fertility inhibition protein FinO [Salmonella enterica subsp. enterica serovar Enteritidis str. 81-2625]
MTRQSDISRQLPAGFLYSGSACKTSARCVKRHWQKKKARARKDLSIYLRFQSVEEAVSTLKPWWPGLFDGDTPRLFACGVREALFEDASRRGIPLSHKKIIRALKAIARSEAYLSAMKAGACRYDTEGYVTEHITVEEEQYALARLAKARAQNARKAELRAVLAQTV